MVSEQIIEESNHVLSELKVTLEREGDSNWIQGITAARECLQAPDVDQGYREAKSVYTTMLGGMGSFSDFYIRRVDPFQQAEANRRLDEIRDRLWTLFQTG